MTSFVQGSVCTFYKNFVIKNQQHTCQYSKSSNNTIQCKGLVKLDQPTAAKTELPNTKLIDNNYDENDDDDFEVLKKAGEFSKEDYSRLIEFIEPCRPIWDHKINLSERSENIKDRFWNQVFVQFEGKYTMCTIKKSWSYIRQKYTREKKLKPSGSEGKKKRMDSSKTFKIFGYTSCNLANDDTILSTDSNVKEKNPKRKQGESFNITHELLKELKESRPIPPVLPVQPNTELNENDTFFKYLSVRMNGLPKETITKLQDEFLSAVRKEHSNNV